MTSGGPAAPPAGPPLDRRRPPAPGAAAACSRSAPSPSRPRRGGGASLLDLEKDGGPIAAGPRRSRRAPRAAGRRRRRSRAPDRSCRPSPCPRCRWPARTPSASASRSRRAPGLSSTSAAAEVLWRDRPLRVVPMASLTKIMTAAARGRARRAAEPCADHAGRASLQGIRGRAAAARAPGPARGAAERPAAGVGQRCGDRARRPRVRQRAALRRADEPARHVARAQLHPLRVLPRPRGGQPLLRARPRGARRAWP